MRLGVIRLTQGVKVALAGSFINFSLGIFYAWTVFAGGLIGELGWSKADATWPYTLELLVFSMAMIFAGRFQDRVGPKKGAVFSGLFTGLALIFCAVVPTPPGITLAFGILFGCAAAFGYAAITPAVVKWFPPEKRGLVTGVVIMSMGAAALFWSPLISLLIVRLGVVRSFLYCGLFLLVAIPLAAQIITVPAQIANSSADRATGPAVAVSLESDWRSTIRRPAFAILWVMMGLSTGIGLMVIGQLVQIAELNYRLPWGFLLVSLFALFNTVGRFSGGLLCDRIGYLHNFKAALVIMATSMLLFRSSWGWPALVSATVLLGFSYGSLYTSYPTAVSRLFGLTNFGVNYGMLFSSVGVAGSLGPLAAAYLADRTGSYNPAFMLGLTASLFVLLLAFILQFNLNRWSIAAAKGQRDRGTGPLSRNELNPIDNAF